MKMINFQELGNSEWAWKWGKSKMMGVGIRKENQTDVTPYMLQLAFIDSSPSHRFYLQNSQPAWDLIIF